VLQNRPIFLRCSGQKKKRERERTGFTSKPVCETAAQKSLCLALIRSDQSALKQNYKKKKKMQPRFKSDLQALFLLIHITRDPFVGPRKLLLVDFSVGMNSFRRALLGFFR